jgi:hypothetical protein
MCVCSPAASMLGEAQKLFVMTLIIRNIADFLEFLDLTFLMTSQLSDPPPHTHTLPTAVCVLKFYCDQPARSLCSFVALLWSYAAALSIHNLRKKRVTRKT